MSRIKGRTDDMLVVRGVNVFPSEVECDAARGRRASRRTTSCGCNGPARWTC